MLVSSENYEKSLLDSAKKKTDAKKAVDDRKAKTERGFLRLWNPLLDKAKESLEKHRAGEEARLTPLKVGEMKALIVGKTGHLPKAKSNKDGAMKEELRSVMGNSYCLGAMPPVSPARQMDEDGQGSDDEEEDGDAARVLDMEGPLN